MEVELHHHLTDSRNQLQKEQKENMNFILDSPDHGTADIT
jgi:hypothetical protein